MNQLLIFLVTAMLMTLQPILVESSKEEGKLPYLFIASTLLSEMLKMVISCGLFYRTLSAAKDDESKTPVWSFSFGEVIRFSVPAFIYFVNNALVFVILQYMSPTSFQIFSCLKTIF